MNLFIDKNIVLVNKKYGLDASYVPSDLVSILLPRVKEETIKLECYNAYKNLYHDALKLDYHFIVFSAYRSYEYQIQVYNGDDNFIAKPGYSEHQTGLALDISIDGVGLNQSLIEYNEGIWLNNNAHKYGFIIRYPKNKESITGYFYEPWHIRYVGKNIANIIYKENLSLEEYIYKYVQKITI